MFLVRLYRILPMLIVVGVTALIIYFVVSLRSSAPQAKSVVLRFFTWTFGILTVALALFTLYAVLEGNAQVTELIGSCAIAALVCLIITRVCYHVFVAHYPNYAWKPTHSRTISRIEEAVNNFMHGLGFKSKEGKEPIDTEGEDGNVELRERRAQAKAERAAEAAAKAAAKAEDPAAQAAEAADKAAAKAEEKRATRD